MYKVPMKQLLLYFLLATSIFSCYQPINVDYHIKNGTIIDGLGNPPFNADLFIKDGNIGIIDSDEEVNAEHTIDATNLVVAPGFIDSHNHSDRSIKDNDKKLNEGFIRQGVTTIVGGPDGWWSPREIRELLNKYAAQGIGTNLAFYVGHNGIRREVMEDDQIRLMRKMQRRPTDDELNQMKQLVREGMELGALGLSTGLMYPGGLYSQTEEVIALAKEVTPFNGIYDSHVRNPVHALIESDTELIEIASQAGIPGKIGHLKAVGLHNEGAITEIIALVDSVRKTGLEIVSDQYPYDGAQTSMLEEIIVIPSEMVENEIVLRLINNDSLDAAITIIKQLLDAEESRKRIKKTSEEGDNGGFAWLKATGYTSMRITGSSDYPELVGKYLSEIAKEMQLDPFDMVCELIIGAEERVNITLGAINENDVRELLIQPWNMIASDGNYSEESLESFGHPRSTGTFPRVLGYYVRELELLSLEEAVRKMTHLPASFLGLQNRGRIDNGLPADLVLFNPDSIRDNSSYQQPNIFASGVIHVFVNGVPVLLEEKMTGNAPGQYLTRSK